MSGLKSEAIIASDISTNGCVKLTTCIRSDLVVPQCCGHTVGGHAGVRRRLRLQMSDFVCPQNVSLYIPIMEHNKPYHGGVTARSPALVMGALGWRGDTNCAAAACRNLGSAIPWRRTEAAERPVRNYPRCTGALHSAARNIPSARKSVGHAGEVASPRRSCYLKRR